jgi:ubiquinone/menaquinone biosynthesis C-methylase UbiE
MDVLREKLSSISGGRILDVATGDGAFIHLLTHNLKDFTEIIGIDCDAAALESAKKCFQDDRIAFGLTPESRIPYEDGSFDTVCLSNSLHHLTDIGKSLGEMLRVLKPGGLMILNELFCDGQNEKQLTHVGLHHLQAEVDTLLGIPHNKTFEKQEILDIAGKLGLVNRCAFVHENEMFNTYVQIDRFAERYRGIVSTLKGYPQYEHYAAELEKLIDRLYSVGVEFASQVMILGYKA